MTAADTQTRAAAAPPALILPNEDDWDRTLSRVFGPPSELDEARMPTWLAVLSYRSYEEAIQEIVSHVEDERMAIWHTADIVASVYHKQRTKAARRRWMGAVAENTGVSKRTVRRYRQLGENYPPALRTPERPLNLYYTGLQADDPAAAVEKALDNGWSPAQLKEHLDNGTETPAQWHAALDDELGADADARMVAAQISDIVSGCQQRANRNGNGPLLTIRVRVDARYGPEAGT